jgi:hypothetical protein
LNFERLSPTYIQSLASNKTIRECLKVAQQGILPISKVGDPFESSIIKQYTIARYERIPDLNSILESISQWQPVILSIKYFDSFDASKQEIPMPSENNQEIGNCAVVVTGFDQYTRQLTIMHSIGANSGMYGHFYLPFDYEPYINDAWTCSI